MNNIRSSLQVARILGVGSSRLSRAVWLGNITPPEKGPGGVYLWTREDIKRAGWQMLGREIHIPEVQS